MKFAKLTPMRFPGHQYELEFPDFPTTEEYWEVKRDDLTIASYIMRLPEGTDVVEVVKILAKFETRVEMAEYAKKNTPPRDIF